MAVTPAAVLPQKKSGAFAVIHDSCGFGAEGIRTPHCLASSKCRSVLLRRHTHPLTKLAREVRLIGVAAKKSDFSQWEA